MEKSNSKVNQTNNKTIMTKTNNKQKAILSNIPNIIDKKEI